MLSHVTTVSTVAPTLATMIGLGVGIDYALFIVTRHFRGMTTASTRGVDRAGGRDLGGAVVFAGGTVTIALVSLAVANIPLVTTMGLMAAIAVVVAVLAAVTLLPATLAIAGPHINSLRVRGRHRGRTSQAGPVGEVGPAVASHPVVAGLAALAILIPLAIPLLSLNLGQKDVAALSKSTTARQAYDLIAKNFGAGVNGPLIVAVSLGSPAKEQQRLAAGDAAEGRLADLGSGGGHADAGRQGRDHRVLQRDSDQGTGGDATTDLVNNLRDR